MIDYSPSALWEIFNDGYDWKEKEYVYTWFKIKEPFDSKKKELYKLMFEPVTRERVEKTKKIMSLDYKPEQIQTPSPYKKNNQRFLQHIGYDLLNLRLLELWAYLDDIFAEIPQDKDQVQQIHYLIDYLYYEHKNVLDDELADEMHRYEYNQLIYKVINKYIYAINGGEVDIVEQLNKSMKKSLEWNAPKQIIGSLFGVIYETGAIKGSKKDLARGLAVLFPNLSESTLLNNLKLSYNEKECKVNYSIDTVEKLNPFKSYLKDSIPKRK